MRSRSATRQGKAGALQQGGRVLQLGEGRDPRRRRRLLVSLSAWMQGLAQLPQAGAAQQRGQEEAVGPQRLANLQQTAGQVVHPVQGEVGDHQVEAIVAAKGRRLFVGDQGRPCRLAPWAMACQGRREIASGASCPILPAARGLPSSDKAPARQPWWQPMSRARGKSRRTSARRSARRAATSWKRKSCAVMLGRRPVAAAAQKLAVEDLDVACHVIWTQAEPLPSDHVGQEAWAVSAVKDARMRAGSAGLDPCINCSLRRRARPSGRLASLALARGASTAQSLCSGWLPCFELWVEHLRLDSFAL